MNETPHKYSELMKAQCIAQEAMKKEAYRQLVIRLIEAQVIHQGIPLDYEQDAVIENAIQLAAKIRKTI